MSIDSTEQAKLELKQKQQTKSDLLKAVKEGKNLFMITTPMYQNPSAKEVRATVTLGGVSYGNGIDSSVKETTFLPAISVIFRDGWCVVEDERYAKLAEKEFDGYSYRPISIEEVLENLI
jgi:hypothetical protein